MFETVQYKDLFSDFFYDLSWKRSCRRCTIFQTISCNFRKKTQLVLSTLSDQNTNLAAHLSVQTCQLPATQTHSFLLGFSITPTTKFKQLLFSIMEILNTSPVCLTSCLTAPPVAFSLYQHYQYWSLSICFIFSLSFSTLSSGSCPTTRAVRNYPFVVG